MNLTPSLRGEVTAKIGDVDYRLRLGFAELVQLESDTGLMIVEIAEQVAKRKLPMRLIGKLFFYGLAGSKAINPATNLPYTEEQSNELINDHGVLTFIPVVGSLLIGAVSGGKGAENAAVKATGVPAA